VAIADSASQVFVSAATAWEIAIKQALGKLKFPIARMTEILHDEGFAPLAMDIRHAIIAGRRIITTLSIGCWSPRPSTKA
jgi:PIN domain nuclease of toxin-antitoxin system